MVSGTRGADPMQRVERPRYDDSAPLAVRMRPRSLDEVVGQQHLLGAGSPLRRLVEPAPAGATTRIGPHSPSLRLG